MTELAMRQENLPDLPAPTSGAGYAMNELILWAQGADAAYRIADRLAVTSFVPGPMQRKPAEIAAAILTGKEIGLEPMAALRSINVIQGTPTINAQAMRGLLQSAGHEIWVVESTATRCVMRGQRAGSTNVQESTWTLDRARGLQLLGKDNWKKQPQAMLVARATAEICRWVASDKLIGVPYATEEMQDDGPVAVDPVDEVKPARRIAKRAPIQATVITPEPMAEPDFDEPAESVDMITDAQLKMLHATLTEQGLKDRDANLASMSRFTGRTITTSKDLTKAEATGLIDSLLQRGRPSVTAAAEPSEPDFDDDWPETAEPPAGGE